jgi:uncharacterized protein (DUF2252 family)
MGVSNRLDFVFTLARQQREADEALVSKQRAVREIEGASAKRWLLAKKHEKMGSSAFGFLRGSMQFFSGALSSVRGSVRDAAERGWIVGDAHAENFGALRSDRGTPWEPGEVRFWINDFDAVQKGLYVDDVLRLCTSAVLAGSTREHRAERTIAWIESALDGYLSAKIVEPSPSIERLLKKVRHRSYTEFLRSRTETVATMKHPMHRFIRGARYAELERKVQRALEPIALTIDKHDEVFAAQQYEAFRVDDTAFRIAGNGSLGVLRVAIAIKPEKPEAPPWLYDLKAMSTTREAMLEGRAALGAVDRAPSIVSVGESLMLLRPLAPQEDKLAMEKVPTEEFEALFRYLGSILGEAHYGPKSSKRPRWKKELRRAIVKGTVALSSLHFAGFVAYASADDVC